MRVHRTWIDLVHGPDWADESKKSLLTKYLYHLNKGEHLLLSKCYMFYYLYKHYLKGTAGIGTGVVTGCLYSERLVIHILYNLYNINGKMRELLNPVPLSF